jgi:hypothetical protein
MFTAARLAEIYWSIGLLIVWLASAHPDNFVLIGRSPSVSALRETHLRFRRHG